MKKSFLDGLWFNAIMSIVSIGVLVEKIILKNYLSGDNYREFVLIIIWIVLAFHFIKITKDRLLQKK